MRGVICLILAALLVAMAFFALAAGGGDFGPARLAQHIAELLSGSASELDVGIFWQLRAPRIALAIITGWLLATAGAVSQAVFLNPLADPYIIGTASAATFGAVCAYLLGLSEFFYGVFGFGSCLALSLLILSLYRRSQSIATLLILGIAISAFLGSFTSFAIYLIGQESFKITAWLMGSLSSAQWSQVGYAGAAAALCYAFFRARAAELDLLLLGDEEAQALGLNVRRAKKRFLLLVSLAVAFSVAFCGLIGFVGLIIPHICRQLLRTASNAALLGVCALAGAVFLLACDCIARLVLFPIEMPIGVITSFFGAPFFIFLALRGRNA